MAMKPNNEELGAAATALKCSTNDFKVSAPVRLYKANGNSWEYTGSWGIAAVVLNQQINAVSIQIVDLSTKSVVLNQECYKEFALTVLSPSMHAFEGDDAIYGLNFAETFDARAFETTLRGLLSLCNAQVPVTANTKTVVNTPKANQVSKPAAKDQPQSTGIGSKLKGLFGGKKAEPARTRPKISGAKNFKHVAHLGFNSKDGFGNVPPEWKAIFDKAGVTEEELKDAKTAKFILKTIAAASPPPPPPPSTNTSSQSSSSSGGPPPPPPPGPMMTPVKKSAPPPVPSKQNAEPVQSSSSDSEVGRGGMLAQINAGNFKLKKVTAEDIPQVDKMSEEDQNSLASKIQMAMQMRRQAVVDDDDEDEDEDWEI